MTGESTDGLAAGWLGRTERIRQIGPDITPDNIQASFGLYAREHEEAGHRAPTLARDLQYGPDPRNRLDVHSGEAAASPLPVLVYVHGGGFVGGDKHIPGTPYYDHIGAWAVSRGMVSVTMTYRLAPEHPWPAGAQDVGHAVAWVTEHIGDYGGDPARVVVTGHSAGATHVAGYLAGHAGSRADAAAGVLLSGIYDLTATQPGGAQAAYFGDDPSQYSARSPLAGLVSSGTPVLFDVAEFDPPMFHQQAGGVAEAFMRRHGTLPPLVYALRHNHISEVAALGIDDDALGIPLLRFIESVTGTVLPRPGYQERAPAA